MTRQLSDEENMLVETVRTFIDRDVKPTVREVEHANEYPEAWPSDRSCTAVRSVLSGGHC